MWPINELSICILVLFIMKFTSYSLQNDVPLGSDVTLNCSCPKDAESSCSVSYPMKNSNTKEFHYEDLLYVLISSFCKKNYGKYRCTKSGIAIADSTMTLALKEWKTNDEITMYRASGDDLILLCKPPSEVTHIGWQWTSYDTVTKDIIHVYVHNKSTSIGQFHNHLNCSYGVKFPVSLNDSGQYKCILPNNSSINTINLVTVEVNAYPSPEVFRNGSVSITCRVSHVISNKHVLLVWAKENRYTSVAVKKENITSKSKQITLNVTDIDKDSVNWTCLVFSEYQLVALAPLTLKYKTVTENHSKSKKLLTTTTQGVDISDENRVLHKSRTTHIYFSILAVFIIFLGSLYVLRRRGGKAAGKTSKSEEIQYLSVSFSMQSNGNERNQETSNDSPAGRPEEQEVLYTQIKRSS
ncbi:uncharacterized protein [Pyxicephalus adspersus]|uniref:uncharacterized protein n=1 Tax=Pyxicephalus adspersus TaxID=30357 RepID=UPI003B5C8673